MKLFKFKVTRLGGNSREEKTRGRVGLDEKVMCSAWTILILNTSKNLGIGRNVNYLFMEGAGGMD